jgi:hypothetical protein
MPQALPAVILALLLCAAGCLVAGVYVLFGAGWAIVAAAPSLLGLAFVLANGLVIRRG